MPLDTISGETSVFKFMPLSAPTLIRPLTFDTAALVLPELTTSDMPATASTKTPTVSKMYGSAPAGSDLTWQKPKPDVGSWTVTASGNVQPSTAERAAMTAVMTQLGKYGWVERQMHTSTKNEGGCVLITSTGKPIVADDSTPIAFSFGGTGYGVKFDDTSLAI